MLAMLEVGNYGLLAGIGASAMATVLCNCMASLSCMPCQMVKLLGCSLAVTKLACRVYAAMHGRCNDAHAMHCHGNRY